MSSQPFKQNLATILLVILMPFTAASGCLSNGESSGDYDPCYGPTGMGAAEPTFAQWENHPDDISSGGNDSLVNVMLYDPCQWDHFYFENNGTCEDNYAAVCIQITILTDSGWIPCYGNGTSECFFEEQEDRVDGRWGANEWITIIENGHDLFNSSSPIDWNGKYEVRDIG